MSSEFIDAALVTTPVKITTIDSVAVVDIHPLSSEWKHYLVTFTPSQPGPVVSVYSAFIIITDIHLLQRLVLHLYDRSEGPVPQPCSHADLEGFASAKV